jgi:hypothetical protein
VLRTAYGINYSRRGRSRRPCRRAQRHGHARLLSQRQLPEPERQLTPAYNWNDGVPAYAPPPFFDPSLNAGFVTGRGTGGSVTYGDPEIGGRMPRYQNWNTGVQYALLRSVTVSASYAGSRAISSAAADAAFMQPARSEVPRARQSPDAAGDARQYRRRAGDRAGRGPALPQLQRHDLADAPPVPAVFGRHDVYGNVARSTYHSLQFTAEKRRADDGLSVAFNYTFSRTEDNLSARTGYDFEQDWSVGVNDQPHVLERHGRLRRAVRCGRKTGSGNRSSGRSSRAGRFRHHAVPLGPPAGLDPGDVQPSERRHLLRGLQSELQRTGADQR